MAAGPTNDDDQETPQPETPVAPPRGQRLPPPPRGGAREEEDEEEVEEEVIHEGELAVTQCGRTETCHVVLYRGGLEYFRTRAALESGVPDGSFVLQEVNDLEVKDTKLLMHLSDGRKVLLEETVKGGLQGWVNALSQVLEPDEPPSRRTRWSLWPVVGEQRANLRAIHRHGPSHSPRANQLPAGGPAGHSYGGMLHLTVGPGSEVPRYVVIQDSTIDLFESQADTGRGQPPLTSIAAHDVTRVDFHGHAFVIGVGDWQLELRVPHGAVLEEWINAFRGMLDSDEAQEARRGGKEEADSYVTPSTEDSSSIYGRGSPSADTLLMEQEMADSRVATWLDSMPTGEPRFHGVLWLSRERRLVSMFAALFKGRIDFWASPLKAAGGQRPDVRILLNEVYRLSVLGCGFVIDHRCHKIGVHAGEPASAEEWSREIRSALSLAERGGLPAPSQDEADQCWVPRVALMKTPRQVRTAEQNDAPGPTRLDRTISQRRTGSPFRSSTAVQLAEARRQACRRDPEDPQGIAAMRSCREALAKLGTSARNRSFSPRSPLEPDAFAIRPPGRCEALAVAEKVSHPPVMTPPPGEPKVASKITGSARGCRPAPVVRLVEETPRTARETPRRRPPAGKASLL